MEACRHPSERNLRTAGMLLSVAEKFFLVEKATDGHVCLVRYSLLRG